jgi:hypothetical protein
MSLTTTTGAAILRPEQVDDLLVLPVTSASIGARLSTVVSTGSTSFRIPRVTADPAAAWLAEGDEISPSDATMDELVITPTKLAPGLGSRARTPHHSTRSKPSAQTPRPTRGRSAWAPATRRTPSIGTGIPGSSQRSGRVGSAHRDGPMEFPKPSQNHMLLRYGSSASWSTLVRGRLSAPFLSQTTTLKCLQYATRREGQAVEGAAAAISAPGTTGVRVASWPWAREGFARTCRGDSAVGPAVLSSDPFSERSRRAITASRAAKPPKNSGTITRKSPTPSTYPVSFARIPARVLP